MDISNKFSPGYIGNLFTLWYTNGKPRFAKFRAMIPVDPLTNMTPQPTTVKTWMSSDEWLARADSLDREVEKVVQEKYVASTVEMFERHAELGREMQTIAFTWLKEHKDELTPGTAVRLLVDGIKTEQDTASIPDMIKKLKAMPNEKLLDTIQDYFTDLPAEIDAY